MWTGVGIAAAGLALGGAFGYLSFKDGDKKPVTLTDVDDNNESGDSKNIKAKFDDKTAIYLAIFGAGVAMTVTGAALTGIFGYRYTHTEQKIDISFNISPTSASLTWNF